MDNMFDFGEELTMPSGATRSMFEAKVPGQSLTEEPGNYPWERPPQYTSVDEVMGMYMRSVSEEETLYNLFNMLDAKIPVSQIVQSMTLQGIGEGLYTPDVALLIMDELAMLIIAIAKAAGVEVRTGYEQETKKNMMNLAKAREDTIGITPEQIEMAKEAIEEKESGGLMSRPEPEPMEE